LKKLLLTILTNNFITTLMGIFPDEIGKKLFVVPKNADGKSLQVL
jgi:hypothetical protein